MFGDLLGGHSFMIAADESAEGPGLKEFGKQMAGAVCFIDGDGNDHIGRILLNGQDVTEVRSDRSVKIADALSQMNNLRHRMDSIDR